MTLQQALERRRSVRPNAAVPCATTAMRPLMPTPYANVCDLPSLLPAAPICSFTSSTTSPMLLC